MTSIVSFDEAGNTGSDLLNQEQKVFVLASVCVNNNDLNIFRSLFKSENEIHFTKLKNSQSGRDKIIEFINHDLISENKIIYSVSYKEYVVVAQIVNKLIETFYYKSGKDLYKMGLNLYYTNSIYFFGKNLWNKELFSILLSSFVIMIRKKDQNTVNTFYQVAQKLYHSGNEDYYQLLIPVLGSKTHINEILNSIDKYSIDITLSTFMVLCDKWYKKINQKFIVHFDNSKQIDHYQEYISFLCNMNCEETEVGYGSRTMTFPLQIEQLKMVDSSENLSIQFADLIASTIAFMYNNQNDKQKPFIEEIKKSKLLNLKNNHTLIPELKFTPKDLNMSEGNGQNFLDFVAGKQIEYEKFN